MTDSGCRLVWIGAASLMLAGNCYAQPDIAANAGQADPTVSSDVDDYRESLRNARQGLIQAGDFAAALTPAELLVNDVAEPGDPEAANDRIMLAFVLSELDRFEEAETNFYAVIEDLSDEDGDFSRRLIAPMQLLGRSYYRAGRYPEAVTVFDEARHISQRNDGLFNIEQTSLIDDTTSTYLAMGDTTAAEELQVERLTNAQRRFGQYDPQVIPFHQELGNYYERSRMHSSAREQYEQIVDIQSATAAAEPNAIAEPLRLMAQIDLRTGNSRDVVEDLEELVSMEGLDAYQRGLALAVLGDAAIVASNQDEAAARYAEAFAQLQLSAVVDPNEYFADPAIIRLVPPLMEVDRELRSWAYAWGGIIVEFDVDAEGRLAEVTGVGAQPQGLVEAAYVERLNEAYFRPQLVDGKAVRSTGMRFTHQFRYYIDPDAEPEDADAARD